MASAATSPKAGTVAFSEAAWQEVSSLRCRLAAELKVSRFAIGDLLCLSVNSVIDTGKASNAEIPVHVNGKQIGWAEFEAAGDRLAVRLTELA